MRLLKYLLKAYNEIENAPLYLIFIISVGIIIYCNICYGSPYRLYFDNNATYDTISINDDRYVITHKEYPFGNNHINYHINKIE